MLADCGQLTLYSLSPVPERSERQNPTGATRFHGYLILGQTVVTNRRTRVNVLRALYDGIGAAYHGAACFNPRHGIQATSGQRSLDLVICFECGNIEEYGGRGQGCHTTGSPQAILDRILTDANVPLAGP